MQPSNKNHRSVKTRLPSSYFFETDPAGAGPRRCHRRPPPTEPCARLSPSPRCRPRCCAPLPAAPSRSQRTTVASAPPATATARTTGWDSSSDSPWRRPNWASRRTPGDTARRRASRRGPYRWGSSPGGARSTASVATWAWWSLACEFCLCPSPAAASSPCCTPRSPWWYRLSRDESPPGPGWIKVRRFRVLASASFGGRDVDVSKCCKLIF